MRQHHYKTTIRWTGNTGTGTQDYRTYERSHTISIEGKPDLPASSDTPFRGDATRHNPEDLFLSSLSACHMLWYLHLCADNGIVVTDYQDQATGVMIDGVPEGGRFTEVVLHPVVTITDAALTDKAIQLHDEAHRQCFIANSCNFPVRHQPAIVIA